MKKIIVIIVMFLTSISYAYTNKNAIKNINPKDKFIITKFYVWEIETNLGLSKGTSLSQEDAENSIISFSKGAIINSKKIEVISIIELSK